MSLLTARSERRQNACQAFGIVVAIVFRSPCEVSSDFIAKRDNFGDDFFRVFVWQWAIGIEFASDSTNSFHVLACRDGVPVESAGEECLWDLIEGWGIASAKESNIAVRIDLFFHGLITAMRLMVKEFHSVSQTDECPVFVDRFVEHIAGNCDVVDVIEDRDSCVCFGRHFGRSVEGDSL